LEASMPAPVAELHNVAKEYEGIEVLQGINISISQGETVAILGPNGAGKTTALSILLGLRSPTSGLVRLFGENPRDSKSRSRVGVMLQESGVPATLRVREIVELFRRLYDNPISLRSAIELAQLERQTDALVATLSGGQRQRLYFALSIVGNPDLLCLDEPTVSMDVEARRQFWNQISLMRERGKTIILTTHYLEEADALATRVIVVNRGKVIADGTANQIKARLGGKSVRFRVDNGFSEKDLRDLGGVTSVTKVREHWTLVASSPEVVLEQLFSRGARLSDLEVVGATLEEAVLSITAEQGKHLP
jgi:ABC-2 type transport system ATP-binding protein